MKLQILLTLLSLVAAVFVQGAKDDEPSDADFLYGHENVPVIEFFPAIGSKPSHGDFRGSTKPKMVEFYNPYCGACQRYKPTFVKLAEDLQDEEEDMEIFAVSCQVHNDLCEEYGILDIPTVALFREGESIPSSIKKLQASEKNPNFILPYLFPDEGDTTSRVLEEEGAESGDNESEEQNNNPEEEEEEEQEDDSNEDENEEENNNSGEEANSDEVEEKEASEEEEAQPEEEEEAESREQNGLPALPVQSAANPARPVPAHIRQAMEQGIDLRKASLAPRPEMVKGAGASMTKEVFNDMDRFQGALKKLHENQKSILRRQAPLGKEAEKVKDENIDKTSGATKAMKAHTPGTEEFKLRTEELKARHSANLKKLNLRTTVPGQIVKSAGVTNDLPANHKPVLPYAKKIKMPRLPQKVAGKLPLIKHLVVLSREEELILDASLSFIFSLKTGLFGDRDPLNKHKKRALQNWLDLLRVSLPPEWGLHETIMDLDNNMDFISQNSANLISVLNRHELPRKEWSHSCTSGPSGAARAFNCGFWKLLHIVSVGVAEHRGGLNLVESNLVSKEAHVFSPIDAAEAMKEFIRNFFPCSECRSHFVAQYDECSNRRCVRLTDETEYASFADWQEVSKWLWEVHNDINVRLLKEKFLDMGKKVTINDEIGALYPSLRTCVSCFRDDGGFDEDGVFLYLEKEYWPGASEYDPAADRLLHYYNTEYVGYAKSWAFLFLGVGIIYLCRPRGVFKRQKNGLTS